MPYKGKNIKVVVVTDYSLLGDGIEHILKDVQDVTVVGEAESITEAFEAVKKPLPDVIIMDVAMLDMEGQKFLGYVTDNYKSTKILLLTEKSDEDSLLWALSKGVYGFLPKRTTGTEMIKAIRKVNEGEIWLGRKAFSKLINSQNYQFQHVVEKLSCREKEIGMLILQGHSNKDIAKKLCISEKTVKCHLTNIFRKIGVASRLKLALHILSHLHQNIQPKS